MSYTWEELREEYSNENYPPFGGPFTDALDPWEWLSKNFDPPKRTEETKIKVTVKKDSEMAKMVDTMKAEKQDFKNRVESGEFSNSDTRETVIDFLVERVNYHKLNKSLTLENLYGLKKIAEEMFYEQIRHAWIDGYANHRDVLNHERIEKYYKSRYGK